MLIKFSKISDFVMSSYFFFYFLLTCLSLCYSVFLPVLLSRYRLSIRLSFHMPVFPSVCLFFYISHCISIPTYPFCLSLILNLLSLFSTHLSLSLCIKPFTAHLLEIKHRSNTYLFYYNFSTSTTLIPTWRIHFLIDTVLVGFDDIPAPRQVCESEYKRIRTCHICSD